MLINERVLVAVSIGPDEWDFLRFTNLIVSMGHCGGELGRARYLAFVSAGLPAAMQQAMTDLGVEVRAHPVDHTTSMALHPLNCVADGDDYDVLIALGLDAVIAGDFSAYVTDDVLGARLVNHTTITDLAWTQAATLLGRTPPAIRPRAVHDGEAHLPCFDPGLLIVPKPYVARLRAQWQAIHDQLQSAASAVDAESAHAMADPALSLSLALLQPDLPLKLLPLTLGFPLPGQVHESFAPQTCEPLILSCAVDAAALQQGLPASGCTGPDAAIQRINALLIGTSSAASDTVDAASGTPAVRRITQYRDRKRRTIESFLAFTQGGASPAYPLEVFLEVSNLCNLKCAMCRDFSTLNPRRFIALREEERGFLDHEAFAGSMEKVLEHALVVHCFGFGEPTLHPGFRDLLDQISRYEVVIDFFTNGMGLTEDLCDFLVERGIGCVTVSFSGANASDYENVYMGGKFEQVLGGIKCLAEAKRRRGADLPRIAINSLSFQHHIDKLPEFVRMMAGHGVNHIFVKQLLGEDTNPVMAQHIAVNRPWIEGLKLAEAKAVAAELGVGISADQFEHSMVGSEEEADQRRGSFVMGRRDDNAGCNSASANVIVPISELRATASKVVPIKPAGREQEPMTALDVPVAEVDALLAIEAPETPLRSPCMEPFKTLYVRKGGRVKSCCFADGRAPALGDVSVQNGLDIWRGAGFEAVRQGIIEDKYPEACRTCVEIGYGPWSHFLANLVSDYNLWFRSAFGEAFLDDALSARIAGVNENAEIAQRQRMMKRSMGKRRISMLKR